MNRRGFLKFLGIGAATAAVAPTIWAEKTPEVYPESDAGPITLKMLQDAYGRASFDTMPAARYIYVRLAPTTLPVSAGDIVYYKNDKRHGVLAYKRKKLTLSEPFGYGIGTLTPGYCGFIQLAMSGTPVNMKPFYPAPSVCSIPYTPEKSYDEMMEQVVLTIDKELRRMN